MPSAPSAPVIMWFRQDLRLHDNPALLTAMRLGPIIPIYILDDEHAADQRMGAASRCWLHRSLDALNQQLDGHLQLFRGPADTLLEQLVQHYDCRTVTWNRCYEPWRINRDRIIKEKLQGLGITVHSDNGSLLWEPWQVLKRDQTPYQIFTPFYRHARDSVPVRSPLPRPAEIALAAVTPYSALKLADLELRPNHPWADNVLHHWQPGEAGAQQRWQTFMEEELLGYGEGRDLPAQPHVSRLSPAIHWGEISVHQLWHDAQAIGHEDALAFQRQLAWREFSVTQLFHHPDMDRINLDRRFNLFPWRDDAEKLNRWQQGLTGIPFVDAGMRELWQTGTMHNRVRMVVESFLVKNLGIHWHHGAAWFWDCLLDADLANNSASWQWIAGCGADAAPYFRIFNPVTQGQKFDPHGDYTRHFVPELAKLPDRYLFCPWQAPKSLLQECGITLGETYPEPMVDLKVSRQQALDAYAHMRQAT
ncbi:deoxyribodipyrimidine photo-lyase [uncultured Desulfuromonas sp.]|uniref:cryptochrome/photolyase family protein n=1 Tax=uncultured Desulfuromonas sp. TaxID=181013 RepID=UPI002AAA929E|nr:deoxyribodipyrimidine photo-lyase [uncultured Desulfuromonas sp.]